MIALHFCGITAIISSVDAFAFAPDDETVLLIDPGHGGLDGGAVAADGSAESGVNLAIALRLRDLCIAFGIPFDMTRRSDTLLYPPDAGTIREKKVWDQRQRVKMADSHENVVLISIHQNYYPDPRPSGIQVLYGDDPQSERLGEIAHENLLYCLCPESRRVASPAPKNIYLMKAVHCPAILAECGFLSNPAEAEKLVEPGYQTKIAAILLASYLQFRQAPKDA